MAKRIINSYWERRRYNEIMRLAKKAENETDILLAKEYLKIRERIIKDMQNMYNKIQAEAVDGEPLISHLYSFNRYFEQLTYLDKELKILGKSEIKTLNNELVDLYIENSNKIGKQFNLTTINTAKAKKVVDRVWCSDKLTWSQRIWRDTNMLKGRLMTSLVDVLTTGQTVDDLTKLLMNDFEVSYNSARRIARTEICHIQTQSTLDTYREAGIEKYRILSDQAEGKCEQCFDLNRKEYYMVEAQVGINLPPLHCNCRCAIEAVIDLNNEENNS